MQYELWHDDGDNRYAVRHPMKYMWFFDVPVPLEEELSWWSEEEWDDSEAEQFEDMIICRKGDMHLIGYFATFTEVYERYRMEHLLNA